MYTNFDTQWQLRCRALTENHNPMSDERWQAMVTRAYGSERERPEAEKKGQRLLKRHIWRTESLPDPLRQRMMSCRLWSELTIF